MKKTNRLLLLAALAVLGAALAGCASSVMLKTQPLEKGADYAIINFIRPSLFGGAIKFGVWDSGTLVGVLTPNCCLQYQASPGKHIFLIRAENWGVVKADVEAGKTYTILAEPRMGLMKANVHMQVVKPTDKRLKEWMRDVTYVAVDPKQRDKYTKNKDDDALRAAKNVESGSAKADDVMSPEDGE